jgi:predicted ATPase
MENIYKKVLTYLLDKKINGFSLEMKANPDSILLSFWSRRDWRNGTPSVYFEMKPQNKGTLLLVDDSGEKGAFFKSIATELGMEQEDKLLDNVWFKIWFKNYPIATYEKQIDLFLSTDRVQLDHLMDTYQKKMLFPAISEAEFQRNLNRIPKKMLQSKAPLRIQKLRLKNIGPFHQLEIQLDKQVTCFIGENGSGKTILLRAIAVGLAGIKPLESVTSEGEWKDTEYPKIQKLLHIKTVEQHQPILAPQGCIEIVYDKNERTKILFENASPITIPPNDNKISVQVSDNNSRDTDFTNLVVGFTQGGNNYRSQSQNKDSFNMNSEPNVKEIFNLIFNYPDETLHQFTGWLKKLCEPGDSPARVSGRKVAEKIFEVGAAIVGGDLKHLWQEGEQPEIFIQTPNTPTGIPMELLSQGYNNVLGWLGYFMQRLWQVAPNDKKELFQEMPAICLIDEIDTYLHPRWQYSILGTLVKYFPNVQFIVTTHSPYLVGSIPNHSMRLYICNKQVEEFTQFDPYGAHIERLSRQIFEVPVRIQLISEMMTALRKAIQQNHFETADSYLNQLVELNVGNDENDPEIESLKIILSTKKRKAGI